MEDFSNKLEVVNRFVEFVPFSDMKKRLLQITEQFMDTSSESGEQIEGFDGKEGILVEIVVSFEAGTRISINKYVEDVVSQYTEGEFGKHFRISRISFNLNIRLF